MPYRAPGVYIDEIPTGSLPIEGVGTAIAAFVGAAASGPFDTPILVTNWSEYVARFGGLLPDAYLPLSVHSYFANGGGAAYIVRVGENGNGTGKPAAELTSAVAAGKTIGRIESRSALAPDDDAIVFEVNRTPTDNPPEGEDAPPQTFDVVIRQGARFERYPDLVVKRGAAQNWIQALASSELVAVHEAHGVAAADRAPTTGTVTLSPQPRAPIRLTQSDLIGGPAAGVGALDSIDNITMIAVPDLMAAHEAGSIDLDGVQAVQTALITHCAAMKDRMAILDTPRGMTAQDVREWLLDKARYDSAYATLYYPWCEVFDPATGDKRFIPPSGAIAGVWGRNDDERGVWKAPANYVMQGVLGLETYVTTTQHEDLNPVGINVIRAFRGRGVRVWGARTLASGADWRYVNVRRLFNYIESSILAGTQWVVFEPNDTDLWQRIRRTVTGFLLGLWRDGALFGVTPEEAFYVKCDKETNPPDVIDAGRVVIEIGIAPVKPAEFVIFRVAQLSSSGVAA